MAALLPSANKSRRSQLRCTRAVNLGTPGTVRSGLADVVILQESPVGGRGGPSLHLHVILTTFPPIWSH